MRNIYTSDAYQQEAHTRVAEVSMVKNKTTICCEENVFYPGGGGQPSDLGSIKCHDGETVAVTRVLKQQGKVYACLHKRLAIAEGDMVTASIDWPRRYQFMRCHTAAHVLMGAIRREVIGYVPKGIDIAEDAAQCALHFDGKWDGTDSDVERILMRTNQIIAEDRTVVSEEYPTLGEAISRFEEIYRGPRDLKGAVQIVTIAQWDANPCGGTHVRTLSEVGPIAVLTHGLGELTFRLEGEA